MAPSEQQGASETCEGRELDLLGWGIATGDTHTGASERGLSGQASEPT